MENKITVTDIIVSKFDIQCNYVIEGTDIWKNYFHKPYCFKINYSKSIIETPKGIAIIPFVCNVLPIIWIFDGKLILNELDSTFFNSIEKFKNGYKDMYPYINFKGSISVENIINYTYTTTKSAVLFSGGVDAFNTLISHIDEKPELITLWGADIAYDNEFGWKPVQNQVLNTSKIFNLNYNIVHTNFRSFINENNLQKAINNINDKLGWWHDFQHGIGIISHSAPLCYNYNIGTIYIASSFAKQDIGKYTCASDPTIDNFVKFGNTSVVHDGYQYNRQMKIHNICNFIKNKKIQIPIRVCWESTGGRNCCNCEKCYRTMMGIIAEGENPKKFGFDLYNNNIRKKMLFNLRYKFIAKYNSRRYLYIQKKLKETYTKKNCPKDLKWFYNLKIYDAEPKSFKLLKKIYHRIKSLF